MSVEQLFSILAKAQIKLGLNKEQQLVVRHGELTDELRTLIKEHKQGIIETIQQQRQQQSFPKIDSEQWQPLSYTQQRLWFLNQLAGVEASYNIPEAFLLTGEVNLVALEQACRDIIIRHPSLRTCFRQQPDLSAQQKSIIDFTFTITVEDLQSDPTVLPDKLYTENTRAFDLSKAPLIRVHFFRLQPTQGVLSIIQHHLISDGWSLTLFYQELTQRYQAYCLQQPLHLPELTAQYIDYIHWQRQQTASEQTLNFWKDTLADCPQNQILPTDYPRETTLTLQGEHHHIQLNNELTTAIQQFAQQQQITLFMLLQGALMSLIYRYSGVEDIIIGTPVTGREHPQTNTIIGFFVDNRVLRQPFNTELTAEQLFRAIKKAQQQIQEQGDIPFDVLIEILRPERQLNQHPLFQISLVLQDQQLNELSLYGLEVEPYEQPFPYSKFDLTVNAIMQQGHLTIDWEFASTLFTRQTIQQMAKHFTVLLEQLIKQPQQPISQLPLLSHEEQQQYIAWSQGKSTPLPVATIHQFIEQQAEENPEKIAIQTNIHRISYDEFNKLSNRLAHYLITLSVHSEQIIAIAFDRRSELLIALLGTLKAGAAFLPLDLALPTQRLEYMLEKSQTKFVISVADCVQKLPTTHTAQVVMIDSLLVDEAVADIDGLMLSTQPETNPENVVHPEQLAYIIFTSGTTGQPKGVELTHQGLVNLAQVQQQHFGFNTTTQALQFAALGFDAAVWEWSSVLAAGGTLHLQPASELRDPQLLQNYLQQHPINYCFLPPAMLSILNPEQFPERIQIVVGGETLNPIIAEPWLVRHSLYNAYGPSENTVVATLTTAIKTTKNITIGRPINNVDCYILDQQQQLVPIGVTGELYIGGIALARGYINDAELTDKHFIIHPKIQTRLYRTGDQARWLADGNIDFIGRNDNQIQLRGYRIELTEIEHQLMQQPAVQQAIVQIHPWQQQPHIVAYLVMNLPIEQQLIAQKLSQQLPQYMLPSVYIFLDELPLTVNHKIDHQKLPIPTEQDFIHQHYIAPSNTIESELQHIWGEILALGTTDISIDANFFQLGGHSIIAMQLLAQINQHWQQQFPLNSLFDHPTIQQFAHYITEHKTTAQTMIMASDQQQAQIAPAQQRLWILAQLEPQSALYNVPLVFTLQGAVNQEQLTSALLILLQRHPSLRTRFIDNSQQEQIVENFTCKFQDLRTLNHKKQQQKLQQLIKRESLQAFDLTKDLLLRVTLIQQQEQRYTLLLTCHHIAVDGWSIKRLLQELTLLYRDLNYSLPEITHRYIDYSLWLQQQAQTETLEKQQHYWQQQLSDLPTIHHFPTDKPRLKQQSFSGAHHIAHLEPELVQSLHRYAQREGMTLFMLLHSALSLLIYRYSGETDIAIGTPVANRTHHEFHPVVGFFANTLILRSRCTPTEAVSQFLIQQKKMILDAFTHQEVSFEWLVDHLQPERSLAHSPLFQIMLILQEEGVALELDGLQVTEGEQYFPVSKFDLTVNITPNNDGLICRWEYATDLFYASTIQRVAKNFTVLLQNLITQSHYRLDQLNLLTESERQQLQFAWSQNIVQRTAPTAIHHLFEQQVDRTPFATALVFLEQSYGYQQLNQSANQLAHYLRDQGVQSGDFIALCCPRSVQMIVGMLAILKAGAAYLPLDPDYPEARLEMMLNDSGCAWVLAHSQIEQQLPLGEQQLIIIDNCLDDLPATSVDSLMIAQQSEDNLNISLHDDSTAYIIYTSGSTGKPKGVMLTHRGAVNLALAQQSMFHVHTDSRILQFASFSFDAATWDWMMALSHGASLYIASKEQKQSVDILSELLVAAKITHATLPPALLVHLNQEVTYFFDALIVAGEACEPETAWQWASKYPLFNAYGPTETTVCATYAPIKVKQKITIGQPIANLSTYVLNEAQQLQPIGAIGELYVGGVGVAKGYHDRDELTAQVFIQLEALSRDPLYRTGDRVRWNAQGELEFINRQDHQIQIRGFRVELGEIEALVDASKYVIDGTVIANKNEQGIMQILAYVILSDCSSIQVPFHERRFALANELKQQLPRYMLPSAFIAMSAFPLTANGKIDANALPKPTIDDYIRQQHVPAKNKLEQQLVSLWQELLGIEKVGIQDAFFDLGGNSLLIIELRERIVKTLSLDVSVVDLFAYPTIESLAEFIRQESTPIHQSHQTQPLDQEQPIAIIGMAGKFPGANNLDEFWENLLQGVDISTELDDQDLLQRGADAASLKQSHYVKRVIELDGSDQFDASYFNISAKVAAMTDPQHRVLLELAVHALEDAGYPSETPELAIGVFVGKGDHFHWQQQIFSQFDGSDTTETMEASKACGKDFLATQISYQLNLTGPSINIGTACSTSLVAIAEACQHLRQNNCQVALAGGVAINPLPNTGYLYQPGFIQSQDGYCRPFDHQASGTVAGSGAGLVVLKALDSALADGDQIYGIIKGWSVTNDGASKVSYTAPSIQGQVQTLVQAYSSSGIKPSSLGYLETHGTATELGDPIEIKALHQAFQHIEPEHQQETSCVLGAVKANIGHLDAAAGVAGLIKTALVLKHQTIPPAINFSVPNPKLALDQTGFSINQQAIPLSQKQAQPRRAGVSCFGIGGTNAHVVLEEALLSDSQPTNTLLEQKNIGVVLPLSAKKEASLQAYNQQLADYLEAHSELNIEDIAFTLQQGRVHHRYRYSLSVTHKEQAIQQLRQYQRHLTHKTVECIPDLVWLFPGQGGQYEHLFAELYQESTSFQQAFDHCIDLFNQQLKQNYVASEIQQYTVLPDPLIAHVVLFSTEYALTCYWSALDLRPQAVLGHSLGEYAAAYSAGIFTLEDSVTLVAARGQLLQSTAVGAMLSVALSVQACQQLLTDHQVSLAAVNGPQSCVLSGTSSQIAQLIQVCTDKNIVHKQLATKFAFHSASMEPILSDYRRILSSIEKKPPQIPMISSLTGRELTAEQAMSDDYWIRQIRETVYFTHAIDYIHRMNRYSVYLELGPGNVLSGLVARQLSHEIDYIVPGSQPVLQTIGRLWQLGVSISWHKLTANNQTKPQRVSLPGYCFQHQHYPTKITVADKQQKKLQQDQWFYQDHWRLQNLTVKSTEEGQTILFFTLEQGLEQYLENLLINAQHLIVKVSIGEQFECLKDNHYRINPTVNADYEQLFHALEMKELLPDSVVHLWSLAYVHSPCRANEFERIAEYGLYSLIYLAQVMSQYHQERPRPWWVITYEMQTILENEVGDPLHSPLLAACKIITCEYQSIQPHHIDFALPNGEGDLLTQAEQILHELEHPSHDIYCAYRQQLRFIQGYDQVNISQQQQPILWQKNKVYLCFGGLGGMGLTFAEHIAQQAPGVQIVLVGRNVFPQEIDWDLWLQEKGPYEHTSEQILSIRRIKSLAEVDILSADISIRTDLQQVITHCQQRYGGIHGIIHSAGIVDEQGIIQRRSLSSIKQSMQSKVYGCLLLDEVLHQYQITPEFIFLCSSLSVIAYQTKYAQVAYAIANEFIDSYAAYKARTSTTHVVAVDWDDWKESGMSARIRQQSEQYTNDDQLAFALTNQEGGEVFLQTLQAGGHRYAICTRPLAPFLQEIQQYFSPTNTEKKDKPTATIERDSSLIVAELVQQGLGVTQLDPNQDFFQLGFDSLAAVKIANQMTQQLHIPIAVEDLMANPSLSQITLLVQERQKSIQRGKI